MSVKICPQCKQETKFNRYCAAYICHSDGCDSNHVGLARCYCGWAADGGNGRTQLEEYGEVIEAEDY